MRLRYRYYEPPQLKSKSANYLLASGSLFLAVQGRVKISSLTAITTLNIFAVVFSQKDGLSASLCIYQNKNIQNPQNPIFVFFPEKKLQ